MPRRDVIPALLPFSALPRGLVDRLPRKWWALANWNRVWSTWISLHFCVGRGGVRTIEIGHRTVAWGRAPFDYEASRRDGEEFERRFDRKYGLTDDD